MQKQGYILILGPINEFDPEKINFCPFITQNLEAFILDLQPKLEDLAIYGVIPLSLIFYQRGKVKNLAALNNTNLDKLITGEDGKYAYILMTVNKENYFQPEEWDDNNINMKAIIKNKSIESIEELQQEVQDLYKNEILVGFYPFDFLLEMANQIEEIAIEQNINFKELVKNAYMQVNNLSPEK